MKKSPVLDVELPVKLTTDERRELQKSEAIIELGIRKFWEVGTELLKVRNSRLYREDYATFQEYCETRWNFSRQRASQIINSTEVRATLSTSGCQTLPETERETRALQHLEPEEQVKVWKKAEEKAGGKPSPAQISETMDAEVKPEPPTEKEPPPKPPVKDAKLAEAEKMVKGNQLLEKTAYNLEELLAHWPEMKPQVAIVLRKYLAMVEKNPSNVLPLERKEA